jgi:dihydrofolate reductase
MPGIVDATIQKVRPANFTHVRWALLAAGRAGEPKEYRLRRVVVTTYVSLDGVMEEPAWTAPYWNDEIAKYKYDELFASDALLLGRVTYQGFAKAWPSMTDTGDFGVRMNSLPKYVASTTLKETEWNATLIKGSIAEEVARMKQQPGQDLLVYGSATFVRTLMQHYLVDEYRLLVYPVILGSGKRLFGDDARVTLKLKESRSFSSGVVLLAYLPDGQTQGL